MEEIAEAEEIHKDTVSGICKGLSENGEIAKIRQTNAQHLADFDPPSAAEYERSVAMYPNLVAECKGYPLCGVNADGLAMAANISFRDFKALLDGNRPLTQVEAQAIACEMNRCREHRPEITSGYLLSPTLTTVAAETDEQKNLLCEMQDAITDFCNEQGFDYSGEGRQTIQMIDTHMQRTLQRDVLPRIEKALNQAVSFAEFRYMHNCVARAYSRLMEERDRRCAATYLEEREAND
jgi:hypothetical protein